MGQKDQAIQTDGRRQYPQFFNLKLKDLLKLMASLILPLVLGIFTVISNRNQQKEVLRQNERDGWYRQQEWQIANKHNELQREMTLEQHRDNLLVTYTTQIGELLERNNGSLTSSSIIATIARAKTLNTIRQLDALRTSYVIRFLYEARQLTNTDEADALDISTVELININKSVFKTVGKIGKLSLTGGYLLNCTLNESFLFNIDLSFMQINHIKFSVTELHNVTISCAKLRDVEFTSATLKDVDFSFNQLKEVNFFLTWPRNDYHLCSRLDNVDMSFARLISVNFESATLQNVDFLFAELQDANFQSAKFDEVEFFSARLYNANFGVTKLYKVDFSFARISYTNFSSTQLENVNFAFAELSHVEFSSARLVNVNFSSAILRNVSFFKAIFSKVHFPSAALVLANFSDAWMPYTNFTEARRMIVSFDRTHLSTSDFRHANVKDAQFRDSNLDMVNFTLANLQKTNFTKTQITERQLRSALSIRGARLPNGTLERGSNLINNGPVVCNSSSAGSWKLQTGKITRMMSNVNSNCYFVLQSYDAGAVMLQRIDLSEVWDSHLWSYSQAVLYARTTNGVLIQLNGMSRRGKIIDQRRSTSIEGNITMRLHKEMQMLEILVEFRAHPNKTRVNDSWCEDIDLFIDYGTESEFLQAPLRGSPVEIDPDARWQQDGITVAGGHGQGKGTNQLYRPYGLYVDDDQTLYVADTSNHRIVEWKWVSMSGEVVAGGDKQGNGAYQLYSPRDVIVDKERESLIICDSSNNRVVRWPRRNGTSGETIVSNIKCMGLTMDETGALYVIDDERDEVRRYQRGESQGTVVAGGNGSGNRLDQLSNPRYIFVDRDHSVYVSDLENNRVMKWIKDGKQGIVVAGGHGFGNGLTQLSYPRGVVVDQLGTVYVADVENNRIMRWIKGATEGNVIVGGSGQGNHSTQLNWPVGLSFDRQGNLYVVDNANDRVQKFIIEWNG